MENDDEDMDEQEEVADEPNDISARLNEVE